MAVVIIQTDNGLEVDRFEISANGESLGDRLLLFTETLVKAISEAQQIEKYGRVLF